MRAAMALFLGRPVMPLARGTRSVPSVPGLLLPRRPLSLSCTTRRLYNYEPNDPRQKQPPRVFKATPVSSREVPPRYTFDDRGAGDSRFAGYDYNNSSYAGWNGGPFPPPPPRRPRTWFGRTMRSTSMRTVMAVAAAGALAFYFSHLEIVPVSGRRRFNCFGEETMRMLGDLQYEQLLEEAKAQGQAFLPAYDPRTVVVRQVLQRLLPVSGMSGGGGGGGGGSGQDDEWEVCVIEDPRTVNAFVLPGGKVFVFSGLFRVARTEDALAAVLGHELAHNLANHHGERASSAIGSTILLTSAFLLTAGLAYFVLRPVVDLVFNTPMSRLQESEADYIGLMLMAEACFDPREAANFWARMDATQQAEPPEWISTHPSNKHRMQKIQDWMPVAMEKRQQSACDGTRDFAERFKTAMRNGILIVS